MLCLLASKSNLSRAFSKNFSNRRIDTHHHVVPAFYSEIVEFMGGDPSGSHMPEWSVAQARDHATSLGIETAIASVTSPGATIVHGEKSRSLARKLNDFCAELTTDNPNHFGFFASLPQMTDVEGTLLEIDYAFNVLKADGVIAFTSYQKDSYHHYLGHPVFKPIWDQLNSHKAVVLIHPNVAPSPLVDSYLPQPLIDYPHETTRTAADLVLTATVEEHPDIKFILSHAGGTLPFIAQRISWSGFIPELKCPLTPDEIIAAFRLFYYDTALSTSAAQLKGLLEIASPDRILFGTDVPYACESVAVHLAGFLEKFFIGQEDGSSLLKKIHRENALKLFPKKFELINTQSTS